MSEPVFRPIVRENGRLDPSSFEAMDDSWIEGWLRARLSGSDHYFPIDTRWDEDPERFVINLLRDAGTLHPAAAAIGRAVLRLLDEAQRSSRQARAEASSASLRSQAPAYLNALFGLCRGVRIEQTFSWFRDELAEIARDPDAARLRWGGLRRVREILFAAVVQAPGWPRAASFGAWSALLRVPEFSTLALAGLGRTFEQRLPYLADWWRHCPPDLIDRELEYMVECALDREELILALLDQTPSLPRKLRAAIVSALEAMGTEIVEMAPLPAMEEGTDRAVVMPAAVSAAVFRALYKAAWRKKFLVENP